MNKASIVVNSMKKIEASSGYKSVLNKLSKELPLDVDEAIGAFLAAHICFICECQQNFDNHTVLALINTVNQIIAAQSSILASV